MSSVRAHCQRQEEYLCVAYAAIAQTMDGSVASEEMLIAFEKGDAR